MAAVEAGSWWALRIILSPAAPVWLKPEIQLQPMIILGRETPPTIVLGKSIGFSSLTPDTPREQRGA